MTDKEVKNIKIISKAIANKKLIQFEYKKLTKVVEPYLIGEHDDNGNIVLRAYSVGGQSKSPSVNGWKFYTIESIDELIISAKDFNVRKEYNARDKDIRKIIYRICKLPQNSIHSKIEFYSFNRY